MPVPSAIDHQATGYSLPHAYWLAKASDLAYKDESTIDQQARAWGFDRVRHHQTRFTPPFPLQDTQGYTMASDHMVITAFRGTEPREIRDWLSDANTPPWPGPAETGYVHFGFAEALQSIFPDVKRALAELRTNGQSVWFTGHSLGGALAMLAGARMYLEEPRVQADGVYTFGQPRTCDRILAAACNKGFKNRMYRFVNNNDIVPQLPPEPVYTHVDTLRYIDSTGRLRDSTTLLGGLADRAKGLTADAFAPASDGVRDHSMHNYIAALEKNLA
ncbi:lipase family protein [Streptantibioticus ferralitis]|uniref:Lipase family protein n=1 Tax=Streptantibioticus ferralitis TaxID=236510 RepID=A0ABT5YXL9_9ACTN|nr:lipase family protein [Streptantibioticus ferralitis]MDF2256157.1 lipase family protein [Streptantibioticus ferralitis]